MPLAATKVLHFCLSLAIFSIVSQVLFIDISSPSTVRLHVFFGLPRIRFPSVVHCSGVLVMAHVKIHKSKSQLKRLLSGKKTLNLIHTKMNDFTVCQNSISDW